MTIRWTRNKSSREHDDKTKRMESFKLPVSERQCLIAVMVTEVQIECQLSRS